MGWFSKKRKKERTCDHTWEITQNLHVTRHHDTPDGQVVEWDWWELHTAQQARAPGWRYLIRVTETDYLEPQKDLRLVLRNQQQVYLPTEKFGW